MIPRTIVSRLSLMGLFLVALGVPAPPASAQVVIRTRAPRAWLGFAYAAETPRGQPGGLRITDVSDDSPAARAGLREGDVLLRVNGLNATMQLVGSLAGSLEPGDTVRLRVERSGRARDVRVIAAKPPREFATRGMPSRIILGDSVRQRLRIYLDSARVALDTLDLPTMRMQGDSIMVWRMGTRADTVFLPRMRVRLDSLRGRLDSLPGVWYRVWSDSAMRGGRLPYLLRDSGMALPSGVWTMQFETGMRAVAGAEFAAVNPDLGDYFGVRNGLLVTRVAPGSPAARAGMKAGDVVVRAGGAPITDVRDLREAVAGAHGQTLRVEIVRMKRNVTLTLKPD